MGEASELGKVGGASVVVEGAGDECVEAHISGFAGDGVVFWAMKIPARFSS